MDSSTMSPADIMALSGNEGMGGGNWLMLIVLFLLICGMGGGFGFGNNVANAIGYENLATSAEVQRGFDQQNSIANEREILSAVNGNSLQGMQNANQNAQYLMGAFNDKYNELQRDAAGLAVGQSQLLANQNECCGATRMQLADGFAGVNANIAQSRYDAALGNAGLVQAIQAEGNATRAMLQENKIEALQAQVNQLQMQNAMSGVVRFPNQWTYSAGMSPFCGCNGGCNI